MKGIASNVIAADAVPGAGRSGHPASRSGAEAAGFPRRSAEGMAFAARWTKPAGHRGEPRSLSGEFWCCGSCYSHGNGGPAHWPPSHS